MCIRDSVKTTMDPKKFENPDSVEQIVWRHQCESKKVLSILVDISVLTNNGKTNKLLKGRTASAVKWWLRDDEIQKGRENLERIQRELDALKTDQMLHEMARLREELRGSDTSQDLVTGQRIGAEVSSTVPHISEPTTLPPVSPHPLRLITKQQLVHSHSQEKMTIKHVSSTLPTTNRYFVGRERQFRLLHEKLERNAGEYQVAIVGLSGNGYAIWPQLFQP